MCGIVGVIGAKPVQEILMNGLQKLEYRGYDSAGIFVNSARGGRHMVKTVGKIATLASKLTPAADGTMGIGHTRWATNGAPTDANAHPQYSVDERFYLVHNGVITNAAALKAQYLADVPFQSQTDTEVVVQLIAKFVRDDHDTPAAAFYRTLNLLKGSYAFVLADAEDPDTLYAAKNKSPLLIGVGEGAYYVGSDAMAMIDQTKQFIALQDGDVVIMHQDGLTITDLAGDFVHRDEFTAQLDASEISKGTYPYYMLKEIDEQPAVMRRIVDAYLPADGSVSVDPALVQALDQADRLYIVAAGTSYHAGLVGARLFEEVAGLPAEAYLASEFGYHMPLLSQHPFFLLLSQSGETADSREVLVKVKKMGYPVLTMTNTAGSTLSREADYTMLLHAGPEIAVASTKAYTAQIGVQAVLAKALGMYRQQPAANDFALRHQLSIAAAGMQTLVDEKDQIKNLVGQYMPDQHDAFYIGRGADYPLSLEAALKLKEVSYVHTEGFAAGELKHGTIALISEDTPVLAFITDDATAAHTRSNLQETEARGAHTLSIVSEHLAEPTDNIVLPDVDPRLSALVGIIPAQLIAYYTALGKGLDVDKPRNLAKSVTVE
ncbi:glutamine--fructose-6-phosphate transaminase (isomerizing) [Schleiferilactobacillus shenzhenensis]|uniref:glutamine--fructose-6-phosphate transaminase (isomerizing) n=1 Tax=Schleiferilactobacillus shenzhenensis TaxID=1231337 RepID=UPI000414C0F5|nr:glutamine--fructose-6-phosphate transaminase (isomerizing) [Schleiferilactobacillus shenzhenensis]